MTSLSDDVVHSFYFKKKLLKYSNEVTEKIIERAKV